MSMDELEISGKRYISSKRAARENRYHVDYIGQLIRSGKIIGSKVGRTWYVEVDSLNNYLGQENALNTSSHISNQNQSAMQTYQQKNIQAASPVVIGGLRYISDDEPLLPPVQKQEPVHIRREVVEEMPRLQPRVQEEDYEYEEPVREEVRYTQPTPKGLLYLTAAVGVVALAGAFSLSYFLQYDTTVEAANVTSSIHF